MTINYIGAVLLLGASLANSQTTGLAGSNPGDRLNQQLLQQRHDGKTGVQSRIVVFTGDRVIAQFVDGGSWKTSMYFVNLENHSVSFQVLFFNDDGTDLSVPILGQGVVRGLNIALDAAVGIEFETSGASPRLSHGWALLSQTTNDSVGGMAVFR
jgi:hypothetical protein